VIDDMVLFLFLLDRYAQPQRRVSELLTRCLGSSVQIRIGRLLGAVGIGGRLKASPFDNRIPPGVSAVYAKTADSMRI
jgi:hypothetical protein